MIWIVGGTHEARALVERIEKKGDVIVSVATPEGASFLPEGINVFVGRMKLDEMLSFVEEHKIRLIIDMSHPFASIVSENLKKVSEQKGVKLVRFVRPRLNIEGDGLIVTSSYEECIELISGLKGTFLFTTGSKRSEEFIAVRGDNRFIFRVLPVISSIKQLTDSGLKINDIVAMVGPFTYDMNVAMLKMFRADYLVTKDSGSESGTDEKLRACRDCGVKAVVIRRCEESGSGSIDELKELIDSSGKIET